MMNYELFSMCKQGFLHTSMCITASYFFGGGGGEEGIVTKVSKLVSVMHDCM